MCSESYIIIPCCSFTQSDISVLQHKGVQKKEKRKIEKKAVFLIEVSDKIILHKRPEKGLLSGLWELPNVDGELSAKELSEQMKKWGIGDYMIELLGEGKHIFSHVEWQMRGYRLQMRDISEKLLEKEEWIAVSREDLEEKYAIPSAFECYRKQIYRGQIYSIKVHSLKSRKT